MFAPSSIAVVPNTWYRAKAKPGVGHRRIPTRDHKSHTVGTGGYRRTCGIAAQHWWDCGPGGNKIVHREDCILPGSLVIGIGYVAIASWRKWKLISSGTAAHALQAGQRLRTTGRPRKRHNQVIRRATSIMSGDVTGQQQPQPNPSWSYITTELVLPAAIIFLVSLFVYPLISLAVGKLLDPVALGVIKGDVSQYMQNFFNFNGLLFSFFLTTTYSVLYQQQEDLYVALYTEISEARSLMEQLTLVCQGRPNYLSLLSSMQNYVDELLLGVRLQCPPAVLVSSKPSNDPLENILYLTSVGVPSVVYDTVRGLRQARGARLGATQRKLPDEHFLLLYVLGALELLVFPLLGAGLSTYEPGFEGAFPGHVLSLQSVIFGFLASTVVFSLLVVQDLRSPISGLYSLNVVVDDMVDGLRRELALRKASAASEQEASELIVGTEWIKPTQGWKSFQPQSEEKSLAQKLTYCLMIGLACFVVFPILVEVLRLTLSSPALLSIREDNNAQWLQNAFTGAGFIFALFVAQTFSFLYGQQEAIYLALYAEVSEAKALLEQLSLVCRTRPNYGELLQGLRDYVSNDLKRLDCPPSQLLASNSAGDPLENILYLTSVGVPSAVYETVKGLRQARGVRLGATQRKIPAAHFVLLATVAILYVSIFPVLSAGCSALDESMPAFPGHIVFFQSILFSLVCASISFALLVMLDLWSPFGDTYNIQAVLEEMVWGLEKELDIRLSAVEE